MSCFSLVEQAEFEFTFFAGSLGMFISLFQKQENWEKEREPNIEVTGSANRDD